MSKATEAKLGSDTVEAPIERRRGMKLVAFPAPVRNRRTLNIGISDDMFSQSGRKSVGSDDTAGNADIIRPAADSPGSEGLSSDFSAGFRVGITIAGFLVAGALGYLMGRRRR